MGPNQSIEITLSPTTADFYRFPVEFCRLLSTFADFRLPVPTESLFMLYIDTGECYMYSSIKRRVNAKRLPPMPGRTGRRCAQEKSCAHSISSPGDRDGADVRAWSSRELGSASRG